MAELGYKLLCLIPETRLFPLKHVMNVLYKEKECVHVLSFKMHSNFFFFTLEEFQFNQYLFNGHEFEQTLGDGKEQ